MSSVLVVLLNVVVALIDCIVVGCLFNVCCIDWLFELLFGL